METLSKHFVVYDFYALCCNADFQMYYSRYCITCVKVIKQGCLHRVPATTQFCCREILSAYVCSCCRRWQHRQLMKKWLFDTAVFKCFSNGILTFALTLKMCSHNVSPYLCRRAKNIPWPHLVPAWDIWLGIARLVPAPPFYGRSKRKHFAVTAAAVATIKNKTLPLLC